VNTLAQVTGNLLAVSSRNIIFMRVLPQYKTRCFMFVFMGACVKANCQDEPDLEPQRNCVMLHTTPRYMQQILQTFKCRWHLPCYVPRNCYLDRDAKTTSGSHYPITNPGCANLSTFGAILTGTHNVMSPANHQPRFGQHSRTASAPLYTPEIQERSGRWRVALCETHNDPETR
jgi:hypothetical protein